MLKIRKLACNTHLNVHEAVELFKAGQAATEGMTETIDHQGSDNSTHVTEYCTVIGPTLYRAVKTAVKEVTRPLTSFAEWGVATQVCLTTPNS